jgi:hypothetical protein
MTLCRLGTTGDHAVRHRYACGLKHGLGDILLHRECRGEDTGMRIRDAQHLQKPLQGTVLAGSAMQHVQRGVRLDCAQDRSNVAVDVEAADPITAALGGFGASLAGAQ